MPIIFQGCMQLIEDDNKPIEVPKDERTPEQIKADEEREALAAKARAVQAQREEEAKKREERVLKLANHYAERDYYRKSLKGNLHVTKEDYIEMIWDRAMFEADLYVREEDGEEVDYWEENAKFQDRLVKKVRAERAVAMKKLEERVNAEIKSSKKL
jgi:hypothetical protein